MGKRADLNDIKDQRFGRMVVLGWDHDERRDYATRYKIYHYYKCKCDCGTIFTAQRNDIKRGDVQSCGCLHKEVCSADLTDILKKRFTRLVVDEYDHYEESTGHHYYKCTCDCGNKIVVRRSNLLTGTTKSCGCQKIDSATKHGLAGTKFYNCHKSMKLRCCDPDNSNYPRYGGRGIKVCDRWLGEDGFIHFKEDMYDSYLEHCKIYGEDNTSIDRIDNDGNYCPENCRWATDKEQMNNRRVTVRYEHCDNQTLRDILDSTSEFRDNRIDDDLIRSRLNAGWPVERAISELPVYHNGQKVVKPFSFREPSDVIHPFKFKDGRNSGDGD